MPIKKPPPLPRSLFTTGPLAPGSGPLPPSPSTIHPAIITDGHCLNGSTPLKLTDVTSAPPVDHVVIVSVEGYHQAVDSDLSVKGAHHTHATMLSVPQTLNNSSNARTVDIVLPSSVPLTETEWDALDETVNALDGAWGQAGSDDNGTINNYRNKENIDAMDVSKPSVPKILLAGLVPPPLQKSSSPLLNSQEYNLYLTRIAQISLHADVYLKALPPLVDTRAATPDAWWDDPKELERVVRMYVAPAIETFGTHRIIFGSSSAVPVISDDGSVIQAVSGSQWYSILRKCIAELGENAEAMTGVMGSNALHVYEME